MRVVADSHAAVWYLSNHPSLSSAASQALAEAEATDGIVISVATLMDLWYVVQKRGLPGHIVGLVEVVLLDQRFNYIEWPIDLDVVAAWQLLADLRDPWDKAIVATAQVLYLPLVTKDEGSKTWASSTPSGEVMWEAKLVAHRRAYGRGCRDVEAESQAGQVAAPGSSGKATVACIWAVGLDRTFQG